MESKVCFKCGIEKLMDEFYKHPSMGDGRLGKCKQCTKRDVTSNRSANVEYYRQYDQKRSSSAERLVHLAKNCKQWRGRNPRKYAAHLLVNNAVRAGKLKREFCVICGAKAHAHHDNYDYPLDVMWLCAVHHSERHKELKKLGIEP